MRTGINSSVVKKIVMGIYGVTVIAFSSCSSTRKGSAQSNGSTEAAESSNDSDAIKAATETKKRAILTEHSDVKTLGWNEPIHLRKFNLEPNDNLEGKTLRAIVESVTHGRDDLKLCSECHHREEALGDYGLNVLKYTKSNIPDPWLYFGTQGARPWAGSNGWAERFIANSSKPESIKTLLKAWARGGFETK